MLSFSIVTPSFNQHDWLRLCAASVADQAGVDAEHLVQDGGGQGVKEATDSWATQFPRLDIRVEKDDGMYDGINRGLRRATGDLCAYLNCDEQYLPGSLAVVREFFAQRPDVEMAFADALVIDGEGRYVCHRQTLRPLLRHTVACKLATLTCATFFRRQLVERGFLFDTSYRVVGDAEWIMRLLRAGVRVAHLPGITLVFTDLGGNLGFSDRSRQEQARLRGTCPAWWTRLSKLWIIQHRLRRLFAGYYRPARGSYRIYTLKEPARRREFLIEHPTVFWKGRVRIWAESNTLGLSSVAPEPGARPFRPVIPASATGTGSPVRPWSEARAQRARRQPHASR